MDLRSLLNSKRLAVVGISAKPNHFANAVFKHLFDNGYSVKGVHGTLKSLQNQTLYPTIQDLPEETELLLVITAPARALPAAEEAHRKGIPIIWFQNGSSTREAIDFCRGRGMTVIHDHCIFMEAEPVKHIHRFHRWIHYKFNRQRPM